MPRKANFQETARSAPLRKQGCFRFRSESAFYPVEIPQLPLYRPALPDRYPRLRRACRCPAIGASPSGKAVDFDSTIRRFESSRPSQPLAQRKIVCTFVTKSPQNKAFLAFCEMSPDTEMGNYREKLPKVSGRYQKIFPFSADFRGDFFRSALGGGLAVGFSSIRRCKGLT